MVHSFDVDIVRRRADLGDVLHGRGVGTSRVASGGEHRDGDLLDGAEVDRLGFVGSCQPVGVQDLLLEAVSDAVHGPVLLRFDSLTHVASLACELVTDILGEVVAEGLQVALPVWPVNGVDAIVLILHNRGISELRGSNFFGDEAYETRGKQNRLVEVVDMELALHVRKAIEHLDSSL